MRACFTTCMMLTFYGIGECLRCFVCDNEFNPACGVDFKPYQYEAQNCRGGASKCVLQRQQRIGDFIAIVRRCHLLGSLANLNESDGCRHIVTPTNNHTFEVCLCSTDYCNTGVNITLHQLLLLCACVFWYLRTAIL
ncbi:hypothetical protein MAR_010181 [Mya arenaria]|uniref:Protein sleepless n=1 Tax=Mya arenaria TaxID=6604 RepID=A0ABY7E498_MYAAR|nr:uncharacterized protein LOC128229930 [Mya arenaria]XP_052797799.1 uncharacterized protein LOC128229930 [Mya arenaria]WAR03623.1 hypothetical protein MAR_010181 [Mya arenaria]